MRIFLFAIISLVLVGVTAPTQIIEFHHPKPYKTIEGPERSCIPFGRSDLSKTNRQFHYQQIHDNVLATTMSLANFTIRRDGTTGYDYSWYSVEMEFIASTCPHKASAASPTFASNIGNDAVTLIPRTTIYFPASICRIGLPEYDKVYLPCG